MRPVGFADRHMMRHQMAVVRKPGVQMEGGRLDPERWLTQMREIEIDGVIRCGTNRAGRAGKHRDDGAMEMAGRNQ